MSQFGVESILGIAMIFSVTILTILLLSFTLMIVVCKIFIDFGAAYVRAIARPETPKEHRVKDHTPTMGGLCMMITLGLIALFCLPWIYETALLVLTVLVFGAIGAWDDWCKICYKRGISEIAKFIAQLIAALSVVILWCRITAVSTVIVIPFIGVLSLPLWLFVMWAVWVILCTINAVNFTDGIDGLATLVLIPNFCFFSILAYTVSFTNFALVGIAFIGILFGFLWYNTHPARIFMGDAGSLSLGAALAFMALVLKAECFIPLTGIIFVIEGVSVVVQILFFKYTGKRFFHMAPLHHHFEIKGRHENQITMHFCIITILACVAAFVLCNTL